MKKLGLGGFTLLELLAAIAIVSLLAALMLPAFAGAKSGARRIACIANLLQLGLATSAYLADNDDRYPIWVNEFTKTVPTVAVGRPMSLDPRLYPNPAQVLAPYVKDASLFQCPKDAGRQIRDFAGLPKLYPKNGGTSYFFAELFKGQTPGGWEDPASLPFACDGGMDWHWPPPPEATSTFHRSNALMYDFHAQIVQGESIMPVWFE